ncbi:hypothetical protein TNCV_3394061 [Trichonephila clavipes]|nr:hypothetical protein TNCV_3394061 [Trichonephila clavipes]
MLTQGANPCENLQCGPGQECDIDRYGIATCQCPPICEPVMRPVCGDDGKTYHSECDMRKSGCEGGTEQNRTVTCMVFKAKANDKRKNSRP